MNLQIIGLVFALFALPWLCLWIIRAFDWADYPDEIAFFSILSLSLVAGYICCAVLFFQWWTPPLGILGIAMASLLPLLPVGIYLEILYIRWRRLRAKYRADYSCF